MSERIRQGEGNAARPANAGNASLKTFIASRWRGEAPLGTVFWRDMLLVGTSINVAAALTAIMLLAAGVSTPLALLVYFAPLPWNLFLFLSVWRSADNSQGSGVWMLRLGSIGWFLLAMML